MKWSNAQYTWFLVYLTETIIVHTLQDVKASNNCNLSLQAPIIAWSGHKCAGDDSPHSWKQIILQTSTLVTTEERHRCYSDNHLHFFIRLLLYSFRGGRFFGAWLAGVPCQKAIVILSILDIAKCQWMDPALDRLFRVPGSVISPNFMVLGCVLCEKWED